MIPSIINGIDLKVLYKDIVAKIRDKDTTLNDLCIISKLISLVILNQPLDSQIADIYFELQCEIYRGVQHDL